MRLPHSSIEELTYCAVAAFAYFGSQDNDAYTNEHLSIMATATHHTALKGAPENGIASLFAAVKARIARYRIYRETVNELSALSNRELADLGLHRSMIKRLAMQAAEEYAAH